MWLQIIGGDVLGWRASEFGPATTLAIALFLLIVVPVVFILTRAYYKSAGERESRWHILMNHSLRKGVSQPELQHIQAFFQSLSVPEADEVISRPARFRARLLEYLSADAGRQVNFDVQMMDKLFAEVDWHIDIQSPKDLQPGEVCGMEVGAVNHYGTIIKIQEADILVSIPSGGLPFANTGPGEHAGLFVYRPGIGGFLLEGSVVKVVPNGLVFRHSGKVDRKGEHHLMAIWEMPFAIVPWPVHAVTEPLDGPEPAAPGKALPEKMECTSLRISDRGMIFRVERAAYAPPGKPEDQLGPRRAEEILKQSEHWELHLDVEDYHFVCRVRTMVSKGGRGQFLMKFLDATEAGRTVLMQAIKKRDPMREQLV